MKKIAYILFTLVLAVASLSTQASDSTSTKRYYYKKSRVQQMISLLDQQIMRNALLPKAAQNYLIDGREKYYGQPTFTAGKQDTLNNYLREINEQGTENVGFYVIIPPPLLLEFVTRSELKGDSVVNTLKPYKDELSELYKNSQKAIQEFTAEVFKGSKLNEAQTKGLLLNLDSFINIDFAREKKGKEKDSKGIVEATSKNEYVEVFYPCLVFGRRLAVQTIKEAITAIRQKSKSSFIQSKSEVSFIQHKKLWEITTMYLSTLNEYINNKGGKFKDGNENAAQFKALAKLDISKMPFTKRAELLNKVRNYEKTNAKTFSKGRVEVSDFAGLFEGDITSFLEDDPFLKQFLNKSNPFHLEVITTSEASVVASQQDFASKIKGRTAHQLALERTLPANVVRISMHFSYDTTQEKLNAIWTINFGEFLQLDKNKQTIILQLPEQPGDFAVMMAQGLKLFEAALKEMVAYLEKQKIKEEVWNKPGLTEPQKTVMPMLAGVYNGLIEQIQSAPESILSLIALARNLIKYAMDQGYQKEVDALLAKLTIDDLGTVAQKIVDDEINQYKEEYDKAVNNKSYFVGKIMIDLIFTVVKLANGQALIKVIKETLGKFKNIKTWKKRKKGKGKGKGKDKKDGKGKTKKPRIDVNPATLVAKYITYDSKGKAKASKPKVGEAKRVKGEGLLTIKFLKAQGSFKQQDIIKAIVSKVKAKGVWMPNASTYKTAIRAWAKSAGYAEVKVSGGVKFVKAPEAFITKAGTGNKQTWKLYANKTAKEQNKQPIIVAEYITVNAKDDKQALKIVSIQSPKQDQAKKQRWLTALFEAVVKNKASEGKASPTKRSVSVITAKATAGINLNAFKGLKEQDKIDKEGQKTLVGKWAANLKLAGKPQAYKYTLVRNDHVRFAKTACFVAGTKVWLHDYRQKNIEDVLPEDTVRAFDASLGQEVLGRVTHTIVKQSSTLIGVYTATDTLWVTPEHPFYVKGKWTPAGSLKKGDQLTLLNHNQLLASKTRHLPRSAQVRIDSIAVKDTVATVYNFTVAHHHNYYVGNVGVLVHNKLCLVEKFTHDQVEYHVFRDDVSGSVHVKFNTGQTKPNGKPKLDRVGRGSIGDGTKKYPGKEKGMLSVEVNVKDGQGNDKHPKVKGNFVLQTIIKYELKEGKTLTSFKATWSGKLRTNLDMYNEGISDGLSKKEAANNTWTGDWFWKNYKLACREDKDVSIKAERDGANVTVVFRKSNTRATGVFVRKIGREWVAYSSSQKKKVLGKGKYDKNKKSLEIIIENAGKMRVDAICSGLVARIKKMARNGKDPVRRVFMTDKKYLAGLPLYLAKRWYVTTKGLEALKKHVREKRVRIADWAFRQKYNFLGLSKDKSGKPTAIYFSKENDFAPKTLVHYTTKEAYEGILKSKVLFPSTKKGHTTFGQGQYFTDIHPSDIGGFRKKDLTQSQINEGLIAAESIAMSTWGQNKRTHLMTHYVVVDVSNIPLEKSSTKGGYQIYLKKNKRYNLNIAGLIRAKGLTPYCTPHVTKKVGAKEEVWQLYASKLHTEPQIKARYVFLGKEKKNGALYIDEVNNPEGQGKSQKKAWLTQLFAAVLSGNEKNTGNLPAKTREISVIVALPKAGVKMSDFSSIRSESQDKINNKGKETLVGAWAADILLGKIHHNYKYTIIRNNSIRFAKAACFVAGTKVWLHDYSVTKIESVRFGMLVRSRELITGRETIGRVKNVFKRTTNQLVQIFTPIDTFLTTPDHPFFANGTWVLAGELKKGSQLSLLDHKRLIANKLRLLPRSLLVVDSIRIIDTVTTVYNFTVSKYHNYYVGNIGVLVHNASNYEPPNLAQNEGLTLPDWFWDKIGDVVHFQARDENKGGSAYDHNANLVFIAPTWSFRSKTPLIKKSVAAHEYGHAYHYHTGLVNPDGANPRHSSVKALFDGAKSLLPKLTLAQKKWLDKSQVQQSVAYFVKNYRNKFTPDEIKRLLTVVAALYHVLPKTKQERNALGWAHDANYYDDAIKRSMEFFANCTDVNFNGNEILEDFFSDMYYLIKGFWAAEKVRK